MQKYYDKTPTQGSTNPVRSDGLNQQLTQIGLKLGDLTQLQTTDKSNLVGAINELNSGKASQAALAALNNAVAGKASQSELTALSSQVSGNKSDSDAALAALNGKIGDMSALETESKSTLVEAINEATASVSVTIVGDTMVFNRGALVNGTVLMIN